MYNPFIHWPIGDDWDDHLARGSTGGIDYKVGVGSVIRAPIGGNLVNLPNNGSLGNTARLVFNGDGDSIEFAHLSRFVTARNGVEEGDIIGYTGGAKGSPGAGLSTGPHLHVHAIVNGRRINWLSLLSGGASGGGIITIPVESENYDMGYAVLFHLPKDGRASGTPEQYVNGRGTGDDMEWPTYNDQWFVQTEPDGPLKWVRYPGTPTALVKAGVPVVETDAVTLRDKAIHIFGHVPEIGGEIRYR